MSFQPQMFARERALSARGLQPKYPGSRGTNDASRQLSPSRQYSLRKRGTRVTPLDVSIHHWASRHLPDRYVSSETPHSTPLYDAHIILGHAKLSFKKKLHRLRLEFERADVNGNGLVPLIVVHKALAAASIRLPDNYVSKLISTAAYDGDGRDIHWRAVTFILAKIKFLAADGLSEVELAFLADEISKTGAGSALDADGNGRLDVDEIRRAFDTFDVNRDKNIGPFEISAVMRTLRMEPRARERSGDPLAMHLTASLSARRPHTAR
jgi:Ca2+-binding EF-hand superfamily protein